MGHRVQAVNLGATVIECTNTFAALARSKGLRYSLAIDPSLPPLVHADEVRVQQILGNLIGKCAQLDSDDESPGSIG